MLKVALVGAGIMGSNHARVIQADRRAVLTHVIDPDLERAREVGAAAGAAAGNDLRKVIGEVDVAIVAVPTEHHLAVGLQLLEAGIPCLIEKPIAGSVEDARRLVEAAARHGVTLAVGHVERFNAAVQELETLVTDPIHLDFRRISSFSPRAREGVVRDLMIHDLDIACLLARSEVADVAAVARRTRGDSDDLVVALLTFANGVTASLTASRIGQQKIREIAVTQPDNYVHVDLVREDITIHRVHHVEFLSEGGPRYSQSGVVEIPFLSHRGEPLAQEWAHLVKCLSEGSRPLVTGEDGLRALALAERIETAAVREAH